MNSLAKLKKSRTNWKYITIVVVLALLVGGGILSYLRIIGEEFEIPPIEIPERVVEEETADWAIYVNEEHGYEVKYPKNIITISKQGNKIILVHSIPFEHPDPCDFKGDAPPLKELTDFRVTTEVINRNLRETLMLRESDYLVSNFLLDNKLRVELGFIDDISTGTLNGYRITSGVGGCGIYSYYFPLTRERTLVVQRSFIPEFKPITLDYQKYLKLPRIIPPDKEEKLFDQILSTFRFY